MAGSAYVSGYILLANYHNLTRTKATSAPYLQRVERFEVTDI
jgi:hypothetical protein